jgi:hypothetical protein
MRVITIATMLFVIIMICACKPRSEESPKATACKARGGVWVVSRDLDGVCVQPK